MRFLEMDEKPSGLLWMRNGSSVVDNRLDYQSRDSKIDLPLLRSSDEAAGFG